MGPVCVLRVSKRSAALSRTHMGPMTAIHDAGRGGAVARTYRRSSDWRGFLQNCAMPKVPRSQRVMRLLAIPFLAIPVLLLCAPAHAGKQPAASVKSRSGAGAPPPSSEDLSLAETILRNADFLVACEEGNLTKLKKLLADGADPNASRTSGATALAYAIEGHHSDVVRILLDAKADPNRTSFGLAPLFLAAEAGDLESVKLLLKAGAKVDSRLAAVDEDMKPRNGDTPLIGAASPTGKAVVVRELLAAGADVNAKADTGKTAVMQAVASENAEVLRAILEAKPDVKARMAAPEDIDVLTLAVGKSRADMVGMLIAAGADVNVKIDGEVTLLEFAILSEQPQVAAMLRKAGVPEPSAARLAQLKKEATEP